MITRNNLAVLVTLALELALPLRGHAQQFPGGAGDPDIRVELPTDVVSEPLPGGAGESATALAEKLQNPIGNLTSVPIQNNINFGVGPHSGTQDILNVQPVIPIHLTEDWNVITRTILPLV